MLKYFLLAKADYFILKGEYMSRKFYLFLLCVILGILSLTLINCGGNDDDDSETTSAGSSFVNLSVEDVPETLYANIQDEIKIQINNTGFEHLNEEVVTVVFPFEITFIKVEGEDAENATSTTDSQSNTIVTITLDELDANSTEDIRLLITANYASPDPKDVSFNVSVEGDRIAPGELTEEVFLEVQDAP